MKKTEQTAINTEILDTISRFNNRNYELSRKTRLRSCSAYVVDAVDRETGEVLFHVLTSYNTIVALIDPVTDTLYDFLRYVYGYTSTSAQHISKFSHDYGRGNWGCANTLRYYPV